jgi:hypothetical protein
MSRHMRALSPPARSLDGGPREGLAAGLTTRYFRSYCR